MVCKGRKRTREQEERVRWNDLGPRIELCFTKERWNVNSEIMIKIIVIGSRKPHIHITCSSTPLSSPFTHK